MFLGGFQDIADDPSLSHIEKVKAVYRRKNAVYVRVLNQGNFPKNSVPPLVGETFEHDGSVVTLHHVGTQVIKGFELLHVCLTVERDGVVVVPPTEDVYIASPPLNEDWSDEVVAQVSRGILARVGVR